MSTEDEIRKLEAELNRLDAVGPEKFNEDEQRASENNSARMLAVQARKGTSGPSGVGRAAKLGIPASLVPRCGASTKEGGECKQPAGAGTEHYGSGKCKYHGGANGKSLKHGRYSGLLTQELSDLVTHFEQDDDILNTESDIALLRSITHRFIAEYDDWLGAILHWHLSYQEGKLAPKPVKVLELSEAHKLLDTLTKAVERERKARAANAISARDLYRILNEVGRVIETYVEDKDTLLKIREQMLTIRYA